jgi:hypothetical protein
MLNRLIFQSATATRATRSIKVVTFTQSSVSSFTRSFHSTGIQLAIEDDASARAQRLKSFLETIRGNENIRNQLKSVQLVIASKIKDPTETPSLMQQLQLLSDKEVRAEMVKLSEVMKAENVNLSKEDVGWLMQSLKAQMGEEDK